MTFVARISPFAHKYLKSRSADLLTDECVIFRSGTPEIDPVTNRFITTSREEIYSGPCRLWESQASLAVQVNDEQTQVTTQYLSLPYDIDPIPEMEDVVKITSSPDPDVVGRSFTLGAPARGGNLRATRRFVVKGETSTKEVW